MSKAEKTILFLDIEVLTDDIQDAFPILQILRPTWPIDSIRKEKYATGRVNCVTTYFLSSDKQLRDGLVVRVHGLDLGDMGSSEMEFLTMQVAHAAGCFPAVLASFRNGIVYQYAPGRPVVFQDLQKPVVCQEITRQLARFHSVNIDSLELYNRQGERVSLEKTTNATRKLEQILGSIPDQPADKDKREFFLRLRQIYTDNMLQKEFEFLKSTLENINLPTTIVHNDAHYTNLIIDDTTGSITILDYELASFGYEYLDLMFLLRSKLISDMLGYTNVNDVDLTDDMRDMYIQMYIEAKKQTSDLSTHSNSNMNPDLIAIQHHIMDLMVLFLDIVNAFAWVDVDRVDSLNLIKLTEDKYWAKRHAVPDMVARYVKLKQNLNDSK